MNNFNLYVPTRVLFGQGQIAGVAKQVPAGARVRERAHLPPSRCVSALRRSRSATNRPSALFGLLLVRACPCGDYRASRPMMAHVWPWRGTYGIEKLNASL